MADSGIGALILVITSIIIATSVGVMFIEIGSDFSSLISDRSSEVESQIRTDFKIISFGDGIHENGTVKVNVKNTGSETIRISNEPPYSKITTTINGEFEPADRAEVREGESEIWDESENLVLIWDNPGSLIDGQENSVSVFVNQNEDSVSFCVNC